MSNNIYKIIILVKGYVGVGKTTFCNTFAHLPEHDFTKSPTPGKPTNVDDYHSMGFDDDPNQRPINTYQQYGRSQSMSNGKVSETKVKRFYNHNANCYMNFSKTISILTIWEFLSIESRMLLESGHCDIDKYSNLLITLVDTSGFDQGVNSLPSTMLRNLNAVILLISVSPTDMDINHDSTEWTQKTLKNMRTYFDTRDGTSSEKNDSNHSFDMGKKNVVNIQCIGSKCDLLFQSRDYCMFKNQVFKNNSVISNDQNKECFKDIPLVNGDDETLALHYISNYKGNFKIVNFFERICNLHTSINPNFHDEEVNLTTKTLRLISSETNCNVNIIVYKLVAKIMDGSIKDRCETRAKSIINEKVNSTTPPVNNLQNMLNAIDDPMFVPRISKFPTKARQKKITLNTTQSSERHCSNVIFLEDPKGDDSDDTCCS